MGTRSSLRFCRRQSCWPTLPLTFRRQKKAKGGEDPYGKLDQQLADLVYKVEGVVYKKTGLRFRGQIIAGTVAGLGVAQMVLYGISFEMLPGPVLIWLGWDIYHRVNKEPPLPGEPVQDKGEAAEAEATSGAGFAPTEGLPAAA